MAAREAELKQARQALEQSKSANASCEAKNLKLYEYSQGLLQQYQRKGVWAALKQKEPTLGIGKVGVETVVQEYHEKFESQRLAQPAGGSP